MAGTLLQAISKDEFERARFLSRRKFINDLESDLIGAREEGEMNAKIEMAKEMMREGDSIEKISRITKLPIDKIQQLRKEAQQ